MQFQDTNILDLNPRQDSPQNSHRKNDTEFRSPTTRATGKLIEQKINDGDSEKKTDQKKDSKIKLTIR